jgi:aspartyl-tRNA(Asn)/glutamyl-tRNA(Gln) amidotransferase subunit C
LKITDEQLNHIAMLARLRLTAEERRRLRKDLNDIVAYVEKLNELDVSAVEPTSHAITQKNVFLRPEAADSLSAKDALSNAPAGKKGFFEVPRVIEEAEP